MYRLIALALALAALAHASFPSPNVTGLPKGILPTTCSMKLVSGKWGFKAGGVNFVQIPQPPKHGKHAKPTPALETLGGVGWVSLAANGALSGYIQAEVIVPVKVFTVEAVGSEMIGNWSVTDECGVRMKIVYPGLGGLMETWYGMVTAGKGTMQFVKVDLSGDSVLGEMSPMTATCAPTVYTGRYVWASQFATGPLSKTYPLGIEWTTYTGEVYLDGGNFEGFQTYFDAQGVSQTKFFFKYNLSSSDCIWTLSAGYFGVALADKSIYYVASNGISDGYENGHLLPGLA